MMEAAKKAPPMRHVAVFLFAATVVLLHPGTDRVLPHFMRGDALYDSSRDSLRLVDKKVLRAAGRPDQKCTLVACHTPRTPGVQPFWDYYRGRGHAVAMYKTEAVLHKGKKANSKWCDVAAVRDELRHSANRRVIFADIDTKVDVDEWCKLPDYEHAPIIMNSVFRGGVTVTSDYNVSGTMVQSNAFIVAAGRRGLRAMRRWEEEYYSRAYWDQGAIHRLENGVCGIPGWVACRSNPEQNRCHCLGFARKEDKHACVEKLFNGTVVRCKL